jgi:hypothetical protein
MARATKRWLLLAGSTALAVSGAAIVTNHRSVRSVAPNAGAPRQQGRSARVAFPDDNERGTGNDLALVGDGGGDGASVASPVDTVMAEWRNGILLKNTEAVLAADAVFRREPERFLEALMKLAETDGDERVRAFSTRVLGKLVDPACAPLLTRLLGDKSPYVRMNAAWALGELAVTPEGHAAAAPALRSLHRLEELDPTRDAREAAARAARRLM